MGKVKKSASAKSLARNNKVPAHPRKAAVEASPRHPVETVAAAVVDRRARSDRRKSDDRRQADTTVAVERRHLARREKISRRRQIDPTTCERSYTPEEIEFMNAVEAYKRTSGRMFPTCSEILEVLLALGYEKRPLVEPTAINAEPPAAIPSAAMVLAPDPFAPTAQTVSA